MNSTTTEHSLKTLANIPRPVYDSAWAEGPFVKFLSNSTGLAIGLTGLFSWWTIGFLVFATSIYKQYAEFARIRDFIVWTYFAFYFLVFAVYWMQLQILVPRADKTYPLIDAPGAFNVLGFGAGVKFSAGLTCTIFGSFLALLSLDSSSKLFSPLINTAQGFLLVGLGLVGFYLSIKRPSLGFKVPTLQEIDDAKAQWRTERERQAVLNNVQQKTDEVEDEYAPRARAVTPKLKFSGIFGMQAVKDKLLEPARQILANRQQNAETPRNGILLHGDPGNGKTVFAEALAGELGVPFIQVTYGDVSAKWLGEMPRVISSTFAYAKRCAPCVLFVDEIDSFIRSRDLGSNNSEDLKITNTLLTEIVNLRSHKVVLMGATNYLANLDTAAVREGRFDYKVEITPPDEPARIGLLSQGVKKFAPNLEIDSVAMNSVAKRWAGFSVSRLLAVVKALPGYAKGKGTVRVTYDDWMGALREVQGRNGRVPTDTKSLRELVFQPATREAMDLIARRLVDAHRIELLGGTIPSGILFYGPSGTGKTAAARALAKEAGWAFLSVAGPDLLADRGKLQKLYAEAKDIRPTLIFIDEADDVLRNRQYSASPEICNKLLVLMDGTDEKVKDVVFVAATNHPDQIDPALLRAGRFTEKVEFSTPPQSEIPRFIAGWLKSKSTGLTMGIDVFDVSCLLEGQTIANIEGALQYALNRAISNHSGNTPVVLGMADMQAAVRVVLANDQG